MKAMMTSKTGHSKGRFHPQSNKKKDSKQNSAVRSLLFKILSVFVIGFITKKINSRKK
ncbi:hypothetical protein P7D85_04180 [Enterococcus hulanensis]|uniref:Uncharacterized protein n=1 Tax=Enterococcus hulanensis TaxID=2559929 RepID=A0ABU3EVQ8_9ENTE|nr:hypothetical protein [Enterococcus hulanensis]MDT2598959.1 hypothetical protein [Enterococcus hulanensis]MDT2610610.1 hypothetical protein [Enterococcus hulanensis]MDT2614832.1 hypothetical protein [Enterococcus hulanensis]MDT2627198.1 hypothetical protein [Enterococcus hulanensis]MDT2653902.1 hypothetical protein [Enterococcus hulanensis]